MLLLENELDIMKTVDKETILDTQKIILVTVACLKEENKKIIKTKKLLKKSRHEWTSLLFNMDKNCSRMYNNNIINIKLLYQLNNEINDYIKGTYGSYHNFIDESENLINIDSLKVNYTNLYNDVLNKLFILEKGGEILGN